MRVHIVVTGQVQGVGFRHFTATRARALGLSGFARNLPSGHVEVQAEGDRPGLETLIASLREGPPGAVVEELHANWEDVPAGEREFVIR